MTDQAQEVMPSNGIPEEAIRRTVVPMPGEAIREYFTNKNLFFILNHTESRLQGAPFITYLTNLDMPCDISFNFPLSYEEYALVMEAHMTQTSIHNAASLHVLTAEIMLVAKGMEYEQSPYALPIGKENVLRFISEHKDMVDRWMHFIDSTQVFALSAIKKLNTHYKPAERFEVIDDRNYVGANVAMLYRLPDFIAMYFSIKCDSYRLSYFKPQYEEYMFKTHRLAHYFRSKGNVAALLFEHLAMGTVASTDLTEGIFSMGVFQPTDKHYEPIPFDETVTNGREVAVQFEKDPNDPVQQ